MSAPDLATVTAWLQVLDDVTHGAADVAAKHGTCGVLRVDGEHGASIGAHTSVPAGRIHRASAEPRKGEWLPKSLHTFRRPWEIR